MSENIMEDYDDLEEEIICPHCKGKGRYKTGHSFGSGNIYSRCFVCRVLVKVETHNNTIINFILPTNEIIQTKTRVGNE